MYDGSVQPQLADQRLDLGLPDTGLAGQDIQRINHWYNDRKQSHPAGEELTGSGEFRQMLQHYQQHMGSEEDQHKFYQDVGKHGYPLLDASASKKRRNLPKLPGNLGPMINVHQHFNQPTITNYNHNQYFVDPQEASAGKPSKALSGRSRGGTRSQDGDVGGLQSAQATSSHHAHVPSHASESVLRAADQGGKNSKTIDARAPLPDIRE